MDCIKYFDSKMPIGKVFNVIMMSKYGDDRHNATMKYIGTKLVPGYGGYKGNETLAFIFERNDGKYITLTNHSSFKISDCVLFFTIYSDDDMKYLFIK